MLHHERDKLLKLAENWEEIAERLENQPALMTANTHRLFANELRAVVSRLTTDTKWKRLCALFR